MVDGDNNSKEFNTKANRVYINYYGDFRLVGDGKVTGSWCGSFRNIDGCVRVDLHAGKKWKHKDASGHVYVRTIHTSCKRSSCSVCFKFGWSLRQAGNVATRLEAVAEKYGLEVDHIVVSVPKSDYELGVEDYHALRYKVMRILKSRGVIGGCLIFHAYRFSEEVGNRGWYGSPHWHVLGFIEGGYKCRDCKRKNNCLKGCGGFDDRAWQAFQKDGYYVKVMGKRAKSYYDDKPNIFGSASYQLNHSSYKLGVNRFHICTWFGICGHRVFKSPLVVRDKAKCPICKYDVEKLVYLGGFLYYEKWRREKHSCDKSTTFLFPYLEDGRIAWGLDDRKETFKRRRKVK